MTREMLRQPKVLVVGMQPSMVVYQKQLIQKLQDRGYSVTLALRSFRIKIEADEFSCDDSGNFFQNGNLSIQIKNLKVVKTQKIDIGIRYLLLYLVRPLLTYQLLKRADQDCPQALIDRIKKLGLSHSLTRLLMRSEKFLNWALDFSRNCRPFSKLVDHCAGFDMVICSPCNWPSKRFFLAPEIEYVAAGKEAGCRVAVYQFSLDNFFTRDICFREPDELWAWTKSSGDYFKGLSELKRTKVFVTGSSYWQERLGLVDQGALRPEGAKLRILYAGSASAISNCEDEYTYVRTLAETVEKRGIEMVYRPHPSNTPMSVEQSNFLFDYQNLVEFDYVIGISTTLLVEAGLLGCNVFLLNFLDFDVTKDLPMMSVFEEEQIVCSESELLERISKEPISNNLNNKSAMTFRIPEHV